MNAFQTFNRLWIDKKIKTPLCIFIGGYCGTGKSTIAKALQSKISESIIVPTGIIRATCKPFLMDIDEIYGCHTFGLYRFSRNDEELFSNYKKQSAILYKSIKELCEFARSEVQNIIIDGNHVFPELVDDIDMKWKIDIYMKTTDESQLIKNMTDITHPRMLNEMEIATAKKLNQMTTDYIGVKKQMFEYDRSELAIEYVEKQLERILQQQ